MFPIPAPCSSSETQEYNNTYVLNSRAPDRDVKVRVGLKGKVVLMDHVSGGAAKLLARLSPLVALLTARLNRNGNRIIASRRITELTHTQPWQQMLRNTDCIDSTDCRVLVW